MTQFGLDSYFATEQYFRNCTEYRMITMHPFQMPLPTTVAMNGSSQSVNVNGQIYAVIPHSEILLWSDAVESSRWTMSIYMFKFFRKINVGIQDPRVHNSSAECALDAWESTRFFALQLLAMTALECASHCLTKRSNTWPAGLNGFQLNSVEHAHRPQVIRWQSSRVDGPFTFR